MWLTSEAKALSSDPRIIPAIQYATQTSIYPAETTAAELTTAQTLLISFIYALRQRDLPLIKTLLEVSSAVPQIKSTFLSVWLRDDFCFPRGDVAACLSTLGRLLLDGLQFPWAVAATIASLNVKYSIQECFSEADDSAGQVLLSTMNTSVSEGTQTDFTKELHSKESQTTLKHVSFQLPIEKISKGTQAGLIVYDRGVLVKPELSSTGVQTIDQSMDTALHCFSSTSHLIHSIQKDMDNSVLNAGNGNRQQPLQINTVLNAGNGNRQQPLQINTYKTLPAVQTKAEGWGVSVKPEWSTTGVQSMGTALKPSTCTSHSFNPAQKTTNDSGLRTGNVYGLQNMLVNSYGHIPSVEAIAQDHSKCLPTLPYLSYGSLPKSSKNQRNTPSTMNDDIFSDLKVSFASEQSTTRIQTTAESVKDSGVMARTGTQLQTTSSLASSSITEHRDKVEDGAKNTIVKSSLDSNILKEGPIPKGMANELLYRAIQKDDTKSIVTAINTGADVNHEGVMRKRPLHIAASAGRIEPAIELIHRGADVDSVDDWGETPLFVASVAGHLLMAEILVSAGANINPMNKERNRPLHVAASAGQLEVVRLLLTNGADVDCRGESLRTPLHCAALWGHLSVVGLLLDRGADPMAVEVSGHTPLSLAKSSQHNLVAEFLYYRGRL